MTEGNSVNIQQGGSKGVSLSISCGTNLKLPNLALIALDVGTRMM